MTRIRGSRDAIGIASIAAALLAAVTLLVTAGCGGRKGPRIDPILQLSTLEALERGKSLMEEGKHNRASRYLTHAFESSPNSREGREALLLAADALYQAGGIDNFVRCEAKYRDFINRFPTSERTDYAQLQVANCLAERIEKPDRDQTVAKKALAEFEEMSRLYPTSGYLAAADERANNVRNQLASSEYLVGEFYMRYRLCRAAINRLEPIPDDYPTYDRKDDVMVALIKAYTQCRQLDQATDTYQELIETYPDNKHVRSLDRVLEKARKRQEEG